VTKPFKGVIELDVRDSKPDWTPFELPKTEAVAALARD
jgi:hypothetical protein